MFYEHNDTGFDIKNDIAMICILNFTLTYTCYDYKI
jgi:hypothetical protein